MVAPRHVEALSAPAGLCRYVLAILTEMAAHGVAQHRERDEA